MNVRTLISLKIEEKIFINLEKLYKENELPVLIWPQLKNDLVETLTFNGSYLPEDFASKIDIEKGVYELIFSGYELPKDPWAALQMVTIFDNYIMNIQQTENEWGIKEYNIKDNINAEGNLKLPLYEVFDCMGGAPEDNMGKEFRNKHGFLQYLITIQNIPNSYQPAFNLIKHFFMFCELLNISFGECLNNAKLTELILTNRNPYDLTSNELAYDHQLAITEGIKNLFKVDSKRDIARQNLFDLMNTPNSIYIDSINNIPLINWPKIIQDIFVIKLFNLCLPCNDQKAYEGSIFKMESRHHIYGLHTEVQFLMFSGVNLSLEGNIICMKNLTKNAYYRKHYADKSKKLHGEFANELIHLGKLIGIEFTVCNHDEIKLTQASSDYLNQKGFGNLIKLSDYINHLQKPLTNIRGTLFDRFLNNANEQNVNQSSLEKQSSLHFK